MRLLALLTPVLLAGCSATKGHDARLDGTWRLERPRGPEWVLGDMTLTFSNNLEQVAGKDRKSAFTPYRVLEAGTNYVLIEHLVGPHYRSRYTFADGDRALLIPQTTGSTLRFNKVTEPDGAADGSQPFGSGTNRLPGAAGSRR